MRSLSFSLATISTMAALILTGCPSPDTTRDQSANALKIEVEPSTRHKVGQTVQLRLRWDNPQQQALLNTLVKETPNLPTWTSDPPGAVVIDSATGKATFKKGGKITIRANYTHQGKQVQSKVLALDITLPAGIKPAPDSTPVVAPAPTPEVSAAKK